jgi:hypothetical protein
MAAAGTDDHRKQAKGTSDDDDGVVASRWRPNSCRSVRGTVDTSVRPADTEKASCCAFLTYRPMAKIEATDVRATWIG